MRIKSYYAATVKDAIEKARIELGPDAMLLSSKLTNGKDQPLGKYEVVFGSSDSHFEAAPNTSSETDSNTSEFIREFATLRAQIESVKQSVIRQVSTVRSGVPQQLTALYDALLRFELSEEMASELISAIEQGDPPARPSAKRRSKTRAANPAAAFEDRLFSECQRLLKVNPSLGGADQERNVVMLVGPPGAGKTSTLVKLAVRYGVQRQRKTQILSTDCLRLGAAEQLAAYARIIGAACDHSFSVRALENNLANCGDADLVLIDTPGLSPATGEEASEWAAFASKTPNLCVHLVAPATLTARATQRIRERFDAFGPARLILTHVDECGGYGPVLEHSARTRLPVSFLSTGQQIPEDLEEPRVDTLLDQLSGMLAAIASAA